ncbi:MAG: peptidylprolyl isomerase [Prevotella sp.]|jgi:peptidyl-prolyl cis-trans isomerase SurA|nr:peptidylprolyl isomerase [Prevotella sp.]
MNKKIVLFLIAATGFATIGTYAKDAVLMKINNHPVTKSEFEYLYNKNNSASQQQSLDEYLKLFIDYKLKVEEATSQGLDTLKTFLSEYNNYKNQLTQPYLTDTLSELSVAKKIYDRMGENIEVSHILIRLPSGNRLLPEDTLETYKKAIAVREQLFGKDAKSFEDLSLEASEDQGANQSERPGYLGWATSMMFVAPFENGMYATPTNHVSMPVRSAFGYHLIKVHNRRPDPGKYSVSHIMLGFPQREPTEQEIDSVKKIANEVYAKLQTGGDYSELCKQYSTDRQSAENGGSIGWVQTGMRYPQAFMDAVFALRDTGEYSLPFKTPFGFHIVKLNAKEPRESWAETKDRIVRQLGNSDLAEELSALKTANLAKETTCKTDRKVFDSLLKSANSAYPLDSVSLSVTLQDKRTLLTVGKEKFSVADFTEYMQKNGNFRYTVSTDFLSKSYDNFVLAKLKDAYAASLVDKYPEYRNLLREYHDGILLFNVMNDEIWEKAAADTLGLTNYFAANKSKYTWDEPRYKGYIISCADEATVTAAKEIIAQNNNALAGLDVALKTALNNDSTSRVSIKKGIWAKGENKFIDAAVFQSEEKPEPLAAFPHYFVEGNLLSAPEEYTDAKGLVISDYQEVREKEWMQSLRDKYKVEIDQKALKTIK